MPGGGLSVLGKAKNQAVDAAARRVNVLARAAIPDVIEQSTPEFNRHADAYAEAVSKLPEVLTAETLVSAGAEAVAAYGEAQREAQHLSKFSGWVFETGNLSGVTQKESEVVLRILRPTTAMELVKLDEAAYKQVNPSLAAINPVFFTAVRIGVEFGINTLGEAAGIRSRLESAAAGSIQFA